MVRPGLSVCWSVGRSIGRSVIITIKCGKITSMLLSEHLPIIMTDLHWPHRFLDPSASYFRSPSPEPVYSSDGKRMNTREYRKRKQLEEMRSVGTVSVGGACLRSRFRI